MVIATTIRRTWRRLLPLWAVAGFFCWYYVIWFFSCKPEHDFRQLLRGSGRSTIALFSIKTPSTRINLDDAECTSYLTEAVRNASSNDAEMGASYYATVEFSRFSSIECGLYIPSDLRSITIAYPIDSFDDPTYFRVPLTAPLPERLAQTLSELR
jgi:hypothetical protein